MQRNDGLKWIAGAAILLVVGSTWKSARAGNLDLPTAQYYSVMLAPGDRFSYTGAEENVTLTVDDITYTAQINPCDLYERCEFFTHDEICNFWDTDRNDLVVNGPTVLPLAGGISETVSSGSHTQFINQVLARGAYLRLELLEGWGNEGQGVIFDAMSHSLYGLFLDKFKDKTAWSDSIKVWNRVPEVSTGAGMVTETATATEAVSEAIGLSTWAVPTSESRHYQSPQIVQKTDGFNYVWLGNSIAVSDWGSYSEALAFVKGRVFIGTEGAPVESFDVTVTHP